jgi:hypothetical protein
MKSPSRSCLQRCPFARLVLKGLLRLVDDASRVVTLALAKPLFLSSRQMSHGVLFRMNRLC